jgi:hypothetical protein
MGMARSGSVLFIESQVKIARTLLGDNNEILEIHASASSTNSKEIGGSA